MRSKESIVVWIQRRIEQLFDSRHIDFCVFNEWVIPMHQNRRKRQESQKGDCFGAGFFERRLLGFELIPEDFLRFRAHSSWQLPAPADVLPDQRYGTAPHPISEGRIAGSWPALRTHISRYAES